MCPDPDVAILSGDDPVGMIISPVSVDPDPMWKIELTVQKDDEKKTIRLKGRFETARGAKAWVTSNWNALNRRYKLVGSETNEWI